VEEHSTLSTTDAPVRALGPIDASCVVIGAIIGVGIFFTPSSVAALCPSTGQALLAWAIAGVIALCGALVFAELGGMYQGSAAHYLALRDSYGSLIGFLFVFCNATAIVAGSMGIIAIICAQNIFALMGLNSPPPATVAVFAVSLIGVLAAANVIGVKWGSRIQNLTVFAKLLTLIAITIVAVLFAGVESEAVAPLATEGAPQMSFVKGLIAALVPTLFAYCGWQQVLWVSGEVKNPARNLPLSIIGGVTVVVIVYLLVNWAYLHLLGPIGVARSEALAADAVGVVAPGFGSRIIAGAVAVSALGVLNAQLLTGPRLIFGLARDGHFFSAFGAVHHHFRTPVPAIVLLAVIGSALVLAAGSRGIDALLNGVVLIDGVFFTLTGLALIVLRYRRPKVVRPVRVPLAWIVLPIFVLGEIGVVIGAHLDPRMHKAALLGIAWLIFSACLYFAFFRKPQLKNGD
jgi:basic amino acid/polyamine antiporter, APA family